MKWVPFNALLEQSDHLRDLFYGRTRIERPVLSRDQEAELNYNMELAWIFKSEIIVSYFDKGEIKMLDGILTETDSYQKTVTVNDTEVSAFAITNIEFL